jgi:GNAT superfamily N-acetyltransferase
VRVEPISKQQAFEIVKNHHYLGDRRFICKYAYGLYIEDDLLGAVVYGGLSVPNTAQGAFGLPKGNYPDLAEMHRLVLYPNLNGANYGSYLVGKSLRLLKLQGIRAVISYADSSRHYGAIYQACNFIYCGLTAPKNDYLLANGKIKQRGKVAGLQGKWIPRSRKHRYVYLIDKKINLLWKQEAYPKKMDKCI